MAKKTARQEALKKFIADWIKTYNADAILIDGMEDAFIGVSYASSNHARAVYDTMKCIETIKLNEGVDHLSAKKIFVELLNKETSHLENTPIFFDKFVVPSLKNDWLGL